MPPSNGVIDHRETEAAELTDKRNADPGVRLRDIEDSDIDVFFGHQADPAATEMAAFPSRSRERFTAHWARIRADETTVLRAILAGGEVAGYLCSWPQDGQRLLAYWLGREHWGRGIATRALALFLTGHERTRPVYAYVAAHNAGSIRVLEKTGFQREASAPPPEDGIEEYAFVLKA